MLNSTDFAIFFGKFVENFQYHKIGKEIPGYCWSAYTAIIY